MIKNNRELSWALSKMKNNLPQKNTTKIFNQFKPLPKRNIQLAKTLLICSKKMINDKGSKLNKKSK